MALFLLITQSKADAGGDEKQAGDAVAQALVFQHDRTQGAGKQGPDGIAHSDRCQEDGGDNCQLDGVIAARRDELRQERRIENQGFGIEQGNAQPLPEHGKGRGLAGRDHRQIPRRSRPGPDAQIQHIEHARPFHPVQDIGGQLQHGADPDDDQDQLQGEPAGRAGDRAQAVFHPMAHGIGDDQRHIGPGDQHQPEADKDKGKIDFHDARVAWNVRRSIH